MASLIDSSFCSNHNGVDEMICRAFIELRNMTILDQRLQLFRQAILNVVWHFPTFNLSMNQRVHEDSVHLVRLRSAQLSDKVGMS